MKPSILLLAISGINLISSMSYGQAVTTLAKEGQEGHGGFKTRKAVHEFIPASTNYLIPLVEFSDSEYLKNRPDRKKVVIEALQNIELKPNDAEYRFDLATQANTEVYCNYDYGRKRIRAVKLFFDTYTEDKTARLAVPQIEYLLLHEAAHLIDMNEDGADKFAKDVMVSGVAPLADGDGGRACSDLKSVISEYESVEVKEQFTKLLQNDCLNDTFPDSVTAFRFENDLDLVRNQFPSMNRVTRDYLTEIVSRVFSYGTQLKLSENLKATEVQLKEKYCPTGVWMVGHVCVAKKESFPDGRVRLYSPGYLGEEFLADQVSAKTLCAIEAGDKLPIRIQKKNARDLLRAAKGSSYGRGYSFELVGFHMGNEVSLLRFKRIDFIECK